MGGLVEQVADVGSELRHRHRARRDRAVPVATEVGGDDAEAVTEGGQLGRPHAAVEGVTVDEHDDVTVARVVVSELDGVHGPMVTGGPARHPGSTLTRPSCWLPATCTLTGGTAWPIFPG